MKILLIHNKYREAGGGEDAVFHAESTLLSRYGHHVEDLVFDNGEIRTLFDKVLSGIRLIYNPVSARMLRRKIEEFNPDIIHVHNFFPVASPGIFFVARKHNIPVIHTLHNYRLICPSFTLFYKDKIYEKSVHSLLRLDAILKGVYRDSKLQTAAVVVMTAVHAIIGTWRNKVDLYITLTEFARKKFESSAISIPASKLLLKPNFVMDQGSGDIIRKDFFLFAGRLVEYKGIHTLLKAARLGKFKLVVIGDGPMRDQVNDFARQNPNVSYLGFQDNATVMRYMKMCKGLIFPSVWYEGFPVAILEALSVGTIVIASKLGGMAEIIQHGVNGLHFEAGNENDLLCRVVEIDHDPEYCKSLSVKARLTYLEKYTPERNYARLIDIYDYARALKRQPGNSLILEPVQQLNNA